MLAGPLLMLAVRGRRTSERGRELSRRGECRVVCVHASGQPHGDLLEQPAVAVRIAERGERGVTAPRRIRAAEAAFRAGMVEYTADVVEHVAHLDTALDELGARRLDVGHDEMEPLGRARHGRRDSRAQDYRARGAW